MREVTQLTDSYYKFTLSFFRVSNLYECIEPYLVVFPFPLIYAIISTRIA